MSRSIIHRPAVAGFLVAAGLCAAAGADPITSFSGITSWVGTGPNSAALVIDWNNAGPGAADTSLVWGYHWSGPATTGEAMFDAILAADPHLYAFVLQTSEFGDAPVGLGYDPAADGSFPLSPALTFTADSNRVAFTQDAGQIDDSRTAVNSADQWEEGWNAGYWAYWISTDSDLSANGFSDWNTADDGITSEPLSDGDWNALTFAPGFNAVAPAEPTAAVVPEPASLSLLVMGSIWIMRRRNRRDRSALP